MFLIGKSKVDDTEQATVLSWWRPAFKIERVDAKVSEVETSRYNERNTESRVTGQPWGFIPSLLVILPFSRYQYFYYNISFGGFY